MIYKGELPSVPIKIIVSEGGVLPEYVTAGAAGFDISSNENINLQPGRVAKISTGLSVSIPCGYEVQIRPRSGLASKGIFIINSPGTIDSDYRGEILILLANFTGGEYLIKKGDRIAQGVVAVVVRADFILTASLDETFRGKSGFGSTGV